MFARRRLLGALASTLAVGCSQPPPTRVPMNQLRFTGPCGTPAPVLVVLLPGAYSRPSEFVDEGFVAAVQRRRLGVDIVVADAHLGYFQERSVLRRLREDVVLPARAAGTRTVWLVGISLGGMGALAYGARHGSEIDGILAIAPYLGRRALLREIEADGGPAAWRTRPHEREDDDVEREVWAWLAAPTTPPVWLGFGSDDRFADSHRLLASVLPADRRAEVPGGHDWPPWRALWEQWLDRGLLPAACGSR